MYFKHWATNKNVINAFAFTQYQNNLHLFLKKIAQAHFLIKNEGELKIKIIVSFLVRNSFINEAESVIGMFFFFISVHTIHTCRLFIFQAEEFEILRSADHLDPEALSAVKDT